MARQPTREELIQQDIQDLHRLGYAQQLFTRLVDQRAQSVLGDVGGAARQESTTALPADT